MERPINQIFKATSVAIFSFLFSLTVFADNHMEAPQDAALEIYQCNFSDNKDLNDTRKVAAKWDKWADKNYTVPYAGYLMTPYYQRKSDFPYDLFWLGVTEDFTSLGQAQDEWAAKGTKLAAEFDAANPCPNHAAIYSFTVRQPKNQTPDGYLTISGCTNKEGATQADFAAANAKQNQYLDSINVDSGIYYWFMGAGSGIEQAYDYLEVNAHSTLKEWGITPDNFLSGNPGPSDLDGLRECDTPRVYAIEYVGGKTQN